jgi:hypothetical protein
MLQARARSRNIPGGRVSASPAIALGVRAEQCPPAFRRVFAAGHAAAFYLSQLAKGILSGEVAVGAGDREGALVTSEFIVLEIEVKQENAGH